MLTDSDLQAIWLTLRLAGITTVILLMIGTPVAWCLARSQVLVERATWRRRRPAAGAAAHRAVSVNVSPRQLRAGDLSVQVDDILRETGLAPRHLHVELTETAVIGDELRVSSLLARLRNAGVKVWLDDFGTGFSGLSHLRRVPMDGVKIDRSFTQDLLTDRDDLALTNAIIAMATSLGIPAVAEGIEGEAQLEILKNLGCDLGQGYWFGYPMKQADLLALFAEPARVEAKDSA